MSATHLLVRLGAETYALPIGHVLEVTRAPEPTPLPGAPAAVLGLHSLRGEILPVLALGSLLGLEGAAAGDAIVVVEDRGRRGGLTVDALLDVVRFEEAETAGADGELMRGSILLDGALVGVLDVGALLDAVQGRAAA